MTKTVVKNRKDSHGRVLRPGEYERPGGRYEFKYKGWDKRTHSIYDKDLAKLRRKENKIRYDIDQGLDSSQGQLLTLNEVYDMYMHMKRGIKVSTRRNAIVLLIKQFQSDVKSGKLAVTTATVIFFSVIATCEQVC